MTIPKCPVEGKHCYTRADAKRAMHLARRDTAGRHISVYRCPTADRHPAGAGLFHIGHTPRPGRRRRYKVRPIG